MSRRNRQIGGLVASVVVILATYAVGIFLLREGYVFLAICDGVAATACAHSTIKLVVDMVRWGI